MSTTPRTDEQTLAYRSEDGSELVHASFAAELETELAAAKKRIADCEFVMDHRYKIIERQEQRCNEANARAEKAEAELATEREKVRVLRDALERRHTEQGYHRQYVDDVLDATKEANK